MSQLPVNQQGGMPAQAMNHIANQAVAPRADIARTVAEIQAQITVARACPRDEMQSSVAINGACERHSFAAAAQYSYPRGGQVISGPSIRMAEALARYWGNVNYGFRELSRNDTGAEVEAYAHDLQTNTRVSRQFRVEFVRNTRQGAKILTDERDKYEMLANMAQRRVRACILEIIPTDIVEDAVEVCNRTLSGDGSKPFKDLLKEMLTHFDKWGITQEAIEDRLGHSYSQCIPNEYADLRKILVSLRDGDTKREDWFDMNAGKQKESNSDEAHAALDEVNK